MLECFFSNKYKDRGDLFEGLDIWKEGQYRELQGTYPVIFLSFAKIKQTMYEGAVKKVKKENIHHYGFAFKGKEVLIESGKLLQSV